MNLPRTEDRRIVRNIERRRYIVIDNLYYARTHTLRFDGGGELSRDQEFNELYTNYLTNQSPKKKCKWFIH